MLGAIESLMSAVVADRMGNDRHNPNVELIAQGVANIVSPIFGGLPATGAIARTATNIRSGARTPVAGMIHSLTLLVVLVAAAPLASYIPMAILGAILLVVAYNMGEWHEIPRLLKLTKTDISVWLVTFVLTVFADLTLAVEVGMILAALLFIRRVAVTTTVTQVTSDYIEAGRVHILQDKTIPPYVTVFRIHGPFLFGVTDKIAHITDHIDRLPPIVIVRLRNMTAIDATGLRTLEDLADRLRASGRALVLCGAREQPSAVMQRGRLPRAHRRGQHLPEHSGGARTRQGDQRGEITEITEIRRVGYTRAEERRFESFLFLAFLIVFRFSVPFLRVESVDLSPPFTHLFGAQRDRGIDPHGAPGRRQATEQAGGKQDGRGNHEGRGVAGADAEQLRLEQARQQQRPARPADDRSRLATSFRPSARTSVMICEGRAPSASRRPISWTRSATENDTTA